MANFIYIKKERYKIFIISIMFFLRVVQYGLKNENRHNDTTDYCSLDVRTFDMKTPLLLKNPSNETGIDAFYLPDTNGKIIMPTNTKCLISCAQAKIFLNGNSKMFKESDIVCVNGTIFKIDNTEYEFANIKCSNSPDTTTTPSDTDKCTINNSQKPYILLGYKLKRKFVYIVKVCFDDEAEIAKHSISEIKMNYQEVKIKTLKNEQFKANNNCKVSKSLQECYKIENQRKAINRQLGLADSDESYIAKSSEKYLAKGHLTPVGDFTLPLHQKATYFYVNAAPQFQKLNNGNWKRIENSARKFAATIGKDLEIVTGVHGILKSNEIPLYLYKTDNARAVPVPLYFWKFIYDKQGKQGIVVVASNGPYPKFDYECCTYEDFQKSFNNTIPHYDVKGTLINYCELLNKTIVQC